ncbi:MAG: hypothetical protein WC969_00365 [Elusimicrobiota bacterium]|jgi:hypothetical protein
MKRMMMMVVMALAAAPAAFAKGEEAPDLSTAFGSATQLVAAAEKAEKVDTRIETRMRAIGERQLVAVGECYRSAEGNFLDKFAFQLIYKQKVEHYLVEVKDSRTFLGGGTVSESIIAGSQKESFEEIVEEKETENVGIHSEAACTKMRVLYVEQLKNAAK